MLDAIGSFCEPLGLQQDAGRLGPAGARRRRATGRARNGPTTAAPTLLISPCSSHALRNWRAERYAAVADHAAARGWRVVLCGGRSELERDTADAILAAMQRPALDLVGKDTLKQLPALLERADLVMTPDSGPMHIANAMGTKVLGLHAASNPERSGPVFGPALLRGPLRRGRAQVPRQAGERSCAGARKIEFDGVMDLITVEDAIAAFERYAARGDAAAR